MSLFGLPVLSCFSLTFPRGYTTCERRRCCWCLGLGVRGGVLIIHQAAGWLFQLSDLQSNYYSYYNYIARQTKKRPQEMLWAPFPIVVVVVVASGDAWDRGGPVAFVLVIFFNAFFFRCALNKSSTLIKGTQ